MLWISVRWSINFSNFVFLLVKLPSHLHTLSQLMMSLLMADATPSVTSLAPITLQLSRRRKMTSSVSRFTLDVVNDKMLIYHVIGYTEST